MMDDVGRYTLELIEENGIAEIWLHIVLEENTIEGVLRISPSISRDNSTVVDDLSIIQSASQNRRRKGFPCNTQRQGKRSCRTK